MTFQLATLTRRIENRERRLARWTAKADDAADFARIDRLTAKLERSKAKLDALVNPPDTFAFAVTPLDVLTRVEITIVDSPTDDTFTGGDELQFKAYADLRYCEEGTAGRGWTSNSLLETEAVETQTLTLGSSMWNEWADFNDVTLSVRKGTDVLASETFLTADLFS